MFITFRTADSPNFSVADHFDGRCPPDAVGRLAITLDLLRSFWLFSAPSVWKTNVIRVFNDLNR